MVWTPSRAIVCACLLLSGCGGFANDPRERLGRLGVAYSADTFVAQAGEGDADVVEIFLASGMSADARDKRGITALMNAAAGGHSAVVNLLLDKGAKPNGASGDGSTPLMAASWNGYDDVVAKLLEKGADANARDDANQTPLMLAVR